MLNRERVVQAFRETLSESRREEVTGRDFSPRTVALRAHALYRARLLPGEKSPSAETFRKFATGRLALPEIVSLLAVSDVRKSPRIRVERHRLISVFRRAVENLVPELVRGSAKPIHVARLAYELYAAETGAEAAVPSAHTFERLVYGKAADPEIVGLIETHLKKLDRQKILAAFRLAVRQLAAEKNSGALRPRTVALRAHLVYADYQKAGDRPVSAETFRKFAAGDRALPEIVTLLEGSNIRPTARASLDREKLHAVFREAIQRLEARIFKGQARPLQIARRAHEIYSREEATPPSRHTFQRLVYGKVADPEILELIATALKGRG